MVYITILRTNVQELSLIFDVLFEHFLADIPNGANEVSIRPKYAFFPKTLFETGRMQLPDMAGSITFHHTDDVRQRFGGISLNHVVNVILVTLHVSDKDMVFFTDFL